MKVVDREALLAIASVGRVADIHTKSLILGHGTFVTPEVTLINYDVDAVARILERADTVTNTLDIVEKVLEQGYIPDENGSLSLVCDMDDARSFFKELACPEFSEKVGHACEQAATEMFEDTIFRVERFHQNSGSLTYVTIFLEVDESKKGDLERVLASKAFIANIYRARVARGRTVYLYYKMVDMKIKIKVQDSVVREILEIKT